MDDWLHESIALVLHESDEPISGKLVSIEPLGIILSITKKSAAAKPFEGLFEECDIELFISWIRIRYCARASETRVT